MLTPQEVAEHGFSKAHVGGYNMKEVDDFLDQVTEDYGQLYKECAVLKGKIKVLAEKISEYRETEEAMRSTLLSAQKMAKTMVAEAEEEKKQRIADAEKLGLQRKAEVEREVAEAEGKLAAAQASTQQFINQVRELVRREAEFLDKLRSYKVMNLDMESSALYTVAHLRSVRAATINGTSGNLTNAEVIYTKKNERLHDAWEKEIQIVLETIYRMEQRKAAESRRGRR